MHTENPSMSVLKQYKMYTVNYLLRIHYITIVSQDKLINR